MAIYPGASSVTLVEEGDRDGSGDQPTIWPIGVICHTNGSRATCSGMLGLMNRTSQEFHFQIEDGGRVCQFVHTDVRADNNFQGNSFTVNGRLAGYISIETSDRGSPYELSWTDLGQRRALEDLLVWLCQTHNIPPTRCLHPEGPGIGYHAMWGFNTRCSSGQGTYGVYTAPGGIRACLNNPWTNALGKICPGPGKIREFPDLLAAVARRVVGGAPIPGIGDEEVSILIASSDGTAEQRNQWFLLVGGQVHALPTNQTRTDVVALGSVPATGAPIKSQNQQPFRNFTVDDIQRLINLNWSGPRGVFPTIGGYVIPGDPAVAPATDARENAGNALLAINGTVIPALTKLDEDVAKIPTTPGGSPSPIDLAAVAKAVNDDAAARLAAK